MSKIKKDDITDIYNIEKFHDGDESLVRIINPEGSVAYFKEAGGGCHRKNGPAKEETNGDKLWYKDGELHREDGPAIEQGNGNKFWYLNDKLHREDGPAIERANGSKYWYLDGEYHREDGAAIELANGDKEYWLFNKRYGSLPSSEEIEIIKKERIIGGVIL